MISNSQLIKLCGYSSIIISESFSSIKLDWVNDYMIKNLADTLADDYNIPNEISARYKIKCIGDEYSTGELYGELFDLLDRLVGIYTKTTTLVIYHDCVNNIPKLSFTNLRSLAVRGIRLWNLDLSLVPECVENLNIRDALNTPDHLYTTIGHIKSLKIITCSEEFFKSNIPSLTPDEYTSNKSKWFGLKFPKMENLQEIRLYYSARLTSFFDATRSANWDKTFDYYETSWFGDITKLKLKFTKLFLRRLLPLLSELSDIVYDYV